MSYETYKIIHLLGIFSLIVGMTGLLVSKSLKVDAINSLRKFSAILHGVGLVVVLVGGMGLMARLGGGFQPWIIAKIVIWTLLSISTLTLRFLPLIPSITLTLTLYTLAAIIAVGKPF